MEFTVNKDKNFVSFLGEGKTKPYVFDINTGILYSMQNKPMKNLPSPLQGYIGRHSKENAIFFLMKEMIDNCWRYKRDTYGFRLSICQDNVELFQIVDKLNSIGYIPTSIDKRWFTPDKLKAIDDNFKIFAKFCNETKEANFDEFFTEYYPIVWAQKHNIEVNEFFTTEFINKLIDSSFDEKQIKYIINVCRRGIGYYYLRDNNGFDYWDMFNDFSNYFMKCDVLKIDYDKDFFRGMINANRMYVVYKKDYDNRAIHKHYNQYNFNYDNEDFTIVVPQTADDFKDEAEQQSNCVYSCYLSEVVEGNTSVVFIRKKDNPTKSFITCEVSNKGIIKQYLYKYNHRVIDRSSKEYQFKIEFQNWLNENWG